MANFNKVCAVIFVFSCMIATGSCVRECYRQLCNDCPAEDVDSGKMKLERCKDPNLVGTKWPGKNTKRIPSHQDEEVEYACIKMVASSRTFVGYSTDVVRGCALRSNAENMCAFMTAWEKTRDKHDIKCVICDDELCNGAFSSHHAPAAIVLMMVAAFVKLYSF